MLRLAASTASRSARCTPAFSFPTFSTCLDPGRIKLPSVSALERRDGERGVARAAARREALQLYRDLLRAAQGLRKVDDQCGAVVAWFVRERFGRYRNETSSRLRLQHLRQGQKNLRVLRRAQCTRQESGERAMEKVVAYSYGTRGKLRHILKRRIQEVKSRRNLEPPKRLTAQVASLPPEVLPLLKYCEAEAMKLVGSRSKDEECMESVDSGASVLHGVHLEDYVRRKFQWWSEYGGNSVPIAQTTAGVRSSRSTARRKRLYERALGMLPGTLEFDGVAGNTIELVTMQLEHVPLSIDEFFSTAYKT